MTDYDRPATYQDVLALHLLTIAAVFAVGGLALLQFHEATAVFVALMGLFTYSMHMATRHDGINRTFYRRLGVEVPDDD